jgi:hypothetical protein
LLSVGDRAAVAALLAGRRRRFLGKDDLAFRAALRLFLRLLLLRLPGRLGAALGLVFASGVIWLERIRQYEIGHRVLPRPEFSCPINPPR